MLLACQQKKSVIILCTYMLPYFTNTILYLQKIAISLTIFFKKLLIEFSFAVMINLSLLARKRESLIL